MTPADIARTLRRSVRAILNDENEIFRVYFEDNLALPEVGGDPNVCGPERHLRDLQPYSASMDLKQTVFTKERMESTPWYKVYHSLLLEQLLPLIEARYDRIPSDPECASSHGDSRLKRMRAAIDLEILRELPNATGVPSALTMLDTLLSEVDAVAKAKEHTQGRRARERAMTIYPDFAVAGEGGRRDKSSGLRRAVYRLATVKGHAVFVAACGGIMIFRRQEAGGVPLRELDPFRRYVEKHAGSLMVDKPSGQDGKNILGCEPEDLKWN